MRRLAVVLLCALARLAFAQSPQSYSNLVRERLRTDDDFLFPAPAGWNAAFIGVRNDERQGLATINFYNDSLRAFAQTGIPRITIADALPCAEPAGATTNAQSATALYLLASDEVSFALYRLAPRFPLMRIAALDPGACRLAPDRCSLAFIGAARGRDSAAALQFFVLAHFTDEPYRYALASYDERGTALWQQELGARAVHAFLPPAGAGLPPMIYFSTDAAQRSANDTLRLPARRAIAGAFTYGGVLAWTCILGERTARSWCAVAAGAPPRLACAVAHGKQGDILMIDPANGVVEHSRRFEQLAPRSLCAGGGMLAVALQPDTVAHLDTALREIFVSTFDFPVDSETCVRALPGAGWLVFNGERTAVVSPTFSETGWMRGGMAYETTGLARYSGAGDGRGIFCAELPGGGAALRAVVPNPLWWWFRYRLAAAIAALAALGAFAAAVAGKKYFFYRTYYNQLVRSSAATGIIALNRQQRVIHVNDAARSLLRIAPYIPLQRHISEYLPGPESAELAAIVRDCMRARRARETTLAFRQGAVQRTLLSRARPTISRGGILAGCMLQLEDISRTIERERLVNWASVAHHIAHEMKTPIGTVLLNAQHLQKSEEDVPEKARKYLRRIVAQTDRLGAILQTFLRIARFSAPNIAPANVSQLAASLAAEYAELVPPEITVSFLPADGDTTADVDASQLTTALRNVLDNAVAAVNPNAGTIAISVGAHAASPDGWITIAVRDTGKGMSETCKARLFEPFYTETPGGSGIGMMIVKRIVDEHKGLIEVESEEGNGTEIRILLPRADSAS